MADKEKERGRLFSIQVDGSDSVPFIIKKDKLLIGRGDSCEIRIYVDGVAHEHCIITFNEEGRGFIEPVNKCGLTYINGEMIERQVSLEHNDIITVVKRSFRFHYPTSCKFYVPNTSCEAASFEDNMVRVLADFEVEDVFTRKGKDISEKRVTFGPRLSPEEFDKSMPPASPLRKGSLPRDKLKIKTPSLEQEVIKSQIKKNLFMNSPANKATKTNSKFATPELPESSVVLRRLNYTPGSMKQVEQEEISKSSRPLFSEIVKKSVPAKNTVQKVVQKSSPQRFIKKAKLKESRKAFYKSPRRPVNPRLLAVGSTGHANSPETIIISKKRFNPNSSRNSISSSKRRKSLRLLQGEVTEISSEGTGDVQENNLIMANNTPNCAPTVEKRKSSAIKRKVNDENEVDTPAKSREEYALFGKRNASNTSAADRAENYSSSRKSIDTPTIKSVGTPARKSIGTPARNSIGIPARNSIGTPARNSIGTPARNSIGTPARKSIGTPARKSVHMSAKKTIGIPDKRSKSTPASRRSNTPTIINHDEISNGEDEPEVIHEDEPESEVSSEEVDESETPSNSTSLVAAINNVAQIDENNLDKSLKDIHNIVQALSCHSNVPTLGSDRLTADMCTNAVKKLALTISMINAFHMYNRIIDDVSSFPLCFPSTSFESNSNSLQRLQNSRGHQNEDNIRMSRFQDIMQTFFSNSASNQRRRMLRSYDDGLSPDNESPLSNKRSRRSLKVIDSGNKTVTQKSIDSQVSFVSNDVDESNHSDQSSSDSEDITAASSRRQSKSPRTSLANKEKFSSANTSRTSVSLRKDNSFHSPSSNITSADDISFSSDLNVQKSKMTRKSSISTARQSTSSDLELQKSKVTRMSNPSVRRLSTGSDLGLQKSKTTRSSTFGRRSTDSNLELQTPKTTRMSLASIGRQSANKSAESVSNETNVSPEKQKSSEHEKSFIFKTGKTVKVSPKKSPKKIGSILTAYSKMLRNKTSALSKSKTPKVSLVAKKFAMTTSKKLKAQKKEQKHRTEVLKKVKYAIPSPKSDVLKKTQKPSQPLRVSLKGVTGSSDSLKPKLIRSSQNVVRKDKSKKRPSAALRLSGKLLTSPKSLKEHGKRSSVLFKSKGIKNKKTVISSKLSSKKRKSTVNTEMSNKKPKRSRSVNVKSDISKKNDSSVDIKKQFTGNDSEKITAKSRDQRKRKVSGGKLSSPVAKKRPGTINAEKKTAVISKNQSPKTDSEKPKARNLRNKKPDLIVLDEDFDLNKKDSEKVVKSSAKNQRKRKAATENISEREQSGKRPKTVEQSKSKVDSKTKVSKKRERNTRGTSNEESESTSVSEELSEIEQPGKRAKTVKESKSKSASETRVSNKRVRNARGASNEESESTSVSEDISDSDQTDKKAKTTKRKQKLENKKASPKQLRSTRSNKKQDTEDTKLKDDVEEEKIDKKIAKQGKSTERKKNKQSTPTPSPPNKKARNTRQKHKPGFYAENVEIPKITLDIEKGRVQKGGKRKADKPAKTPKGTDKNIATEKTSPKDTPKKGRSKAVLKTGKDQKEASPVRRVQRTLRSRK